MPTLDDCISCERGRHRFANRSSQQCACCGAPREEHDMPTINEGLAEWERELLANTAIDTSQVASFVDLLRGDSTYTNTATPPQPAPKPSRRLPNWIDMSGVYEVDDLHISDVRWAITHDIAYALKDMLNMRPEITTNSAPHVYARLKFLEQIRGDILWDEDLGKSIKVQPKHIIDRVGMRIVTRDGDLYEPPLQSFSQWAGRMLRTFENETARSYRFTARDLGRGH